MDIHRYDTSNHVVAYAYVFWADGFNTKVSNVDTHKGA